MMKNEEYTLKPFDLEKYAKALNELIGMDVAYFQGDPHVDAMIECIVTAKKYEKRIMELEAEVGELKIELKEAEAEYDRVYEQAEADICGNMADGGTSCHWCIAGHTADAVKEMQERLNEKIDRTINVFDFQISECNAIKQVLSGVKNDIYQVVKDMLEGNNV